MILNSAAYSNNGAIFITYDEGYNNGDSAIGMIVLSPLARGGGYHNSIYYTHSSFLRTIQEIFGVYPLLGDAANATNLSDLFAPVVLKSNLPPSLAAIPDKVIFEMTTLSFTNSASDPDLPPQTLTFNLDPGAPTNAAIDAINGIFSWTPTEAQGPSTNLITVRVTDDGTPSLSTTQSFTVVVLESNLPPSLAAIPDKVIFEMTTLSFTNSASDPDLPPQTLTFSLDLGAPTNAAIDAINGIFSWTPTEAQGPSTNLITVRVTDDGTPSLSTTQSFTVVFVPMTISGVTVITNNWIQLSVSGVISGKTNFVEASTDLFSWTPIFTNVCSTNSFDAIDFDAPNFDGRFYRVVQLP